MGIKEKMMDSMIGKMSFEEKKEMMDQMMEQFFADMTDEQKQEMMQGMMPKMMGQMMGGGMDMSMMGKMMGGKETGKGFNPMDMCQKMMSSMSENKQLASFATPELRELFNDWVQQINEELLTFVKDNKSSSFEKIADHLKLSKNSVIYLLGNLAQDEKIQLKID